MTPSEIVGLRSTCLQIALQEAQRGVLRMDIGARAAELAEWAMSYNEATRPASVAPAATANDIGAMQETNQRASIGDGAPFRQIRVDRAYHFEVPGREEWWLFRAGLGGSKAFGPMPDFRSAATRCVGWGKMAVLVELGL